jgi:hypothetical protein
MLLTTQRWGSLHDLTRCKNDNLGVNCAKTGEHRVIYFSKNKKQAFRPAET